ncbi:MAG: mechanosensitive ion channel family protein [Defluviitaleaceae bacterium]|nr:mechanosensitive ion channel family protein [Defluviitaleaceae bacterium]MCL2273778.1 mechanosensitive ion channel family protein [Defluviitaleaceae bacterium]
MYTYIRDILYNAGFDQFSSLITYAVLAVLGVICCAIIRGVIRGIAGRVLSQDTVRGSALTIVMQRVSNIVIPVVFIFLARDLTHRYYFLGVLVDVAFIIVVMLIIFSCIKSLGAVYDAHEVSKAFPIHGILQVVTAIVGIIGGIVIIARLVGQSPMVLLGSLGAMTAIITLIFKDAILGFMAGIILTANKMIQIGDWIELPNHSANGFVIDLTMTTVKVENFDKTITSIPAYTLISDSFINWRGMIEAGARRIMRSLFIDAAMIRICSDEMLERYKKVPLLAAHFAQHEGATFTNIGVFRAYITAYLRNHDLIHQEMMLLVRQLNPTASGIPMEIVAFAKATAAMEFDPIQSDIFDHLYAVISDFDLQVYQSPSGNDIRSIELRKYHGEQNREHV